MRQKYVYAQNGLASFLKGYFPFETFSKRGVFPFLNPTQTYVWRNHVHHGYKINNTYQDDPLEVSNYLFFRTRELFLLQNKVLQPSNVMKKGTHNGISRKTNEEGLKLCRKDIQENMKYLERALYVSKEGVDLPIAFATNALYVMERFNCGNRDYYDNILIPTIKKKIEWIHAEGVA